MNYVFVDYENVHAVDLALIGAQSVQLTLLLGARQTKLDVDLVEKILTHASTVHLVRLNSSGRNASDLALAYYVGRAAQADPNGHFHIVSKDTGFDPLIEHLRTRKIHAVRHTDYSTLDFSAPPKARVAGPEDLLPRVIAHLQKHSDNRPKRAKTLASHLLAFCGKSATGLDVAALIAKLQKAGHIQMGDKEAVTYNFDPF